MDAACRSLVLWLAACGAPTSASPSSTPPSIERYAPGTFSTAAWDFFVAFTPDEQRALFCRADDHFERYEILETHRDAAGAWTTPARPPIFAQWSNADPHITPDGRRVFFISNRPAPGEAAARTTHQIWVAELDASGAWAAPSLLPAPVNDPAVDAWSPSVAANGNLYFGARRAGSLGGSDLWVSRLAAGAYLPPENLGPAINTAGNEVEPWIAPDESYLIFSALGRADSLGHYDLYLSRRTATGWTPAARLPSPINSTASDYNQSVSPDGRWLYFSSTRPGDLGGHQTGDIYRVPMSMVLGPPPAIGG